jgi:pyrroloquinoline quinone biosynthesis protein E
MTLSNTLRIEKKLARVLSKLSRRDSWRHASRKLMVAYVAPERPRRFPLKLQIEASSRCNLCCPSCSHSREQGNGEHLSEDNFCRILSRLPWQPARVVLSGIGEPLTNPQFFSLVDILAERKIRCEFHTNGTLLGARMRQAILSRDTIDTVNISCDGAQKKTFESLRRGADFDRWRRYVGEFLAEARQRRGKPLTVGVNMVISQANLDEIGDILRLARALGFDGIHAIHPIPLDDTAAALCPSPTASSTVNREYLSKLGRDLGLNVACYFRRNKVPPAALPRCLLPWEYMFVRANGDVAPCCALFGSEKGAVVGNILEQEFGEIWRGPQAREFRRTSAAGTNALCRICPYY